MFTDVKDTFTDIIDRGEGGGFKFLRAELFDSKYGGEVEVV